MYKVHYHLIRQIRRLHFSQLSPDMLLNHCQVAGVLGFTIGFTDRSHSSQRPPTVMDTGPSLPSSALISPISLIFLLLCFYYPLWDNKNITTRFLEKT